MRIPTSEITIKAALRSDYVARIHQIYMSGYITMREALKFSKIYRNSKAILDKGIVLGLAYADKLDIYFSPRDRIGYVPVSLGQFKWN